MRRIAAALAVTLLAAACIGQTLLAESAPEAVWPSGDHSPGDAEAREVLLKMVQAQENLTRFEGTAAARVCARGRNVLTTSVDFIIERPNRVAVRWLGMTIRPRRGLVFIDPEMLASPDYALSLLSKPGPNSDSASAKCERWVISAIALPQNPVQLRWTLYVDPDTWLIRRAEVVEGAVGATSADEASVVEADYRQAGYRRWEPDLLWAQGRLVLEELLPDFLVNLIMGRGSSGATVSVQLDFNE